LRGTHPPGSTYKPFMATAALQTGKRARSSATTLSYTFGHTFRSHGDIALGSVDMYKSIIKSSNVCTTTRWPDGVWIAMHDFMKPLGFGADHRYRHQWRGARRLARTGSAGPNKRPG
jgi:penicillin-binding protein 2